MTPAATPPADPAALDTPCLLVDRRRLDRNIARMAARCAELGVAHRPHLKTAKSAAVADRIPAARAHGAAVSTVREAEYFAAHGLEDLLYAVCIEPRKLRRLAALAAGGLRLHLAVDEVGTVETLAAAWPAEAAPVQVWLEIDCGEHRSGIDPDDGGTLIAVADSIERAPRLRLGGVFTHGGHGYAARSATALREVAEQERAAAVSAADTLRTAGHAVPQVSVGSTPTAVHAAGLSGVTEMRAGVYVFGDLFQAMLGSCAVDDIALTVLTTVIGRRRGAQRLLVDAGGLALSKDRSAAAFGPERDPGYGRVCTVDGTPLPGARVVEAWQEHGVVELGDDTDPAAFPVGTPLRILPNHACMTAAAHRQYAVLDAGRVVGHWDRVNHW